MKGDEMIELDVPVNFVSILESNSDVPGSSLSSILYQFRVWILIRRDHLFREDISYRQITVISTPAPESSNFTGSKKMSTQEIVKIKVCALRVSIHCDGCQKKVKKVLQKIEGVYKVSIDSEQGKVTVSGDFDPEILIKKLKKHGKRAELWDAPKPNTNGEQTQQPIVKDMQLDNGKEGKNGSGSGPNGETIQQQQPQRGGQQQIPNQQRMLQAPTQQPMERPAQQQIQRTPNQPPQQLPKLLNPNQQQVATQQPQQQALSQQQIQQLRQLQGVQQEGSNQQQRQPLQQLPQMIGLQDVKVPGPNPNQQAARLDGPKGDESSDDDSEEYDEEEESEEEDVLPPLPQLNKMKPVMGNAQGSGQMPPSLRMNPGMNLGQQLPPQMMRAGPSGNGAPNGGNGASIGANGGGNIIPVAVNAGSSNNGLGGRTGGGGSLGGSNQIPGASGVGNIPLQMNAGSAGDGSGGKKGDGTGAGAEAGANQNSGTGGGPANVSGGGPNKNGGDGGPQKNASGGGAGGGNAGHEQRNEVHVMPSMMGMRGGAGGLAGQMHNLRPTGQMGPMGMGPPTAIQGVPATVPGGNYFPGSGAEATQLNPYHQQQHHQMAGMMMNQPRDYNERFQPMVHAQAPPDVNYMPPYPYHQIPQQLGPYNNYFSEENPASCSIM
ncbi:heavy metal-associated isoprenylated plant protein 33 isoform X1 [Daucus carota subsp. sativus]|uniref:HMA domain-containing protein n=2 Tax=Daucus carota subsp. sativus TaxID=79200 RepID=A0A166H5P5_DAUCS|nr:PREDICTED: keratin, type I cytoskeletal 9 isoform X1 [Daucus carota subsp. sativus]